MLHQKFWGVAEPCFGNDTITTVRMLTWLLKIEDSSDAFLFELLYHCMFENQSVAQSLGANEETNHPLWVQTWNGWIGTLLVVFMFALLPHACKPAMKLGLVFKINRLYLRRL
jgi:hypothetical protein